MSEAIDTIHGTYYREYSKTDLANRAIGGAVRSLNDRFSNYFDPRSYRAFQLNQNGQFAGIGVEVAKDPDALRARARCCGTTTCASRSETCSIRRPRSAPWC